MLAAALAAPVAACGGRSGALSFWAMDAEGANAKELLPDFERRAGFGVDLQPIPWTAAHQKLLTAFAGDTLPDVSMISLGWLTEFATIGAVTPVPARAAGLLDNQYPGVLAAAHSAGLPYAVPWTVDTAVQYHRRDLLAAAGYEAPPLRLDAWKEMLRAVKRRAPDRFAVLMQLNWPDHLIAIAGQSAEPLLRDQQSRGAFNTPAFREALAFYKSLFDEGLAPVVTSIEAGDPVGELARGFIAVYASGAWTRAELGRRAAELPPERWAVAPMPGWEGPGAAIVAGSGLAVTRSVRNPERALQLIAYLTEPAVQVDFFRIAGLLPSRPSAWRAPLLAADPVIATFAGQLERARAMPTAPEWPRITTEVQLLAERCVRGLLTVPQAAAEMDRVADALLEKRRWLLDRGRAA